MEDIEIHLPRYLEGQDAHKRASICMPGSSLSLSIKSAGILTLDFAAPRTRKKCLFLNRLKQNR
uniref:Uncharacterized protein n=1 Tax=Suricata suricatta TaxID=37032 RepID=A0A673UUI3_SURSU